MESLIGVNDAAKLLNIGRSTAWQYLPLWRKAGLKTYKAAPNSLIRFRASELLEIAYKMSNQAEARKK